MFYLRQSQGGSGQAMISSFFCPALIASRGALMWLAASVVIIRDGSSEPINPPTGYWPDITLITPDIINYWFLLSPTKHIIYFKIPGNLLWELAHSKISHCQIKVMLNQHNQCFNTRCHFLKISSCFQRLTNTFLKNLNKIKNIDQNIDLS